jgi:hypothetical protein
MNHFDDSLATDVVAIADRELAQVSGGSFVYDTFGGAVNWGTAQIVGAVVADKVYGGHATPAARADTKRALERAFTRIHKPPQWVR